MHLRDHERELIAAALRDYAMSLRRYAGWVREHPEFPKTLIALGRMEKRARAAQRLAQRIEMAAAES